MSKPSNFTNLVLVLMFILALVIVGMLFFVRGDEDAWICENGEWVKHGNPSTAMPTEGCGNTADNQKDVEEGIVYNDLEGAFSLTLPTSWEGRYSTEKNYSDEGARQVIFKYVPEVSGTGFLPLLFMVNVYDRENEIASIANLPNNQIVAQTVSNVFTVSQALDMPFDQGTADFDRYAEMAGELDSIFETIAPSDAVYTIIKSINENNQEEKWNIEVSYPEVAGASQVAEINGLIKIEVEKHIVAFKTAMTDWDASGSPIEASSYLWVNYQPITLSSDLVSLYFIVSDYYAGAAHPNARSFSINYSLAEQKVLDLNSLFKVGEEEYLGKISELAKVGLEEEFANRDMEASLMFEEGIAPTAENFDNFNLTDSGIMFNFDQYQVAAYAAGSFNVFITYEELSDILADGFGK